MEYAYYVYAADMDGDGDTDVVSASSAQGIVIWWENDNGSGLEWTEHLVAENLCNSKYIYVADINGDGYMDIVGTAYDDNSIYWWENITGTGSTWSEHIIDSQCAGANIIMAIDFEDDGDMDVICTSWTGDYIAWWENTDAIGQTWTKHIIQNNYDGTLCPFAADVDGDGDIDALGTAYFDNEIT